MNEFEIIDHFFAPLTEGNAAAVNLKDDAAILTPPPGCDVIITSDTLNAGTHFLKHESPANIAHKALRVSLSDLAAMGADPLCYQLNLAFPDRPEVDWLQAFSAALLEDQKRYGLYCAGGDTTSIHSTLSLSITALGTVPSGQAVRRNGAQPGDRVLLTGPVGFAGIGLKILLGEIKEAQAREQFLEAYQRPRPAVSLAPVLRQYARAAIDISDGLIADLEHLCQASGVRACVGFSRLGFLELARDVIESGAVRVQDFLTSGDDYELLIAAPPDAAAAIIAGGAGLDYDILDIGVCSAGEPGVDIIDFEDRPLKLYGSGWKHF